MLALLASRRRLALFIIGRRLDGAVGHLGGLFLALLGDRVFVGRHISAIGGVEIDDIAQQNRALLQRLAPMDHRAHGQRAFANAADHHLTARLNPLGDGDFTLARQQFNAAHFAQIHAHRIVGPPNVVVVDVAAGVAFLILGAFGLFAVVVFFTFDDIDAHLIERRHHVFDLFRGHFLLRQGGIDLVIGQVAALFAAFNQVFDRLIDIVHERAIFARVIAFLSDFSRRRCFCRHSLSPLPHPSPVPMTSERNLFNRRIASAVPFPAL